MINLEVSDSCYDEIRRLLKAAGYTHAFGQDGSIDMHGIALVKQEVTMTVTTDADAFRRAKRQIKEAL